MSDSSGFPHAALPERPSITLDALQGADFETPIRELHTSDTVQMVMAYGKAAEAASVAQNTSNARVFRFLEDLCGIRLRSTERGPLFEPMSSGLGVRSAIPSDFRGDQTSVLSDAIEFVENPVLRARIADIAWTNNRKDSKAAQAAIAAYCAAATAIFNRELTKPYNTPPALDALPLVRRAAQIEHQTTKKSKGANHSLQLSKVFAALYDAARTADQLGIYLRVADLALAHRFKINIEIAADAEDILASVLPGPFLHAAQMLWQLASNLYEKIGDKEGRQRCLMGSLSCALKMRDEVPSAAVKVAHVKNALQILQHIGGREQEELDLEVELRRLQKLAMRDMKSIPIDVSIEGKAEETIDRFSNFALSDALLAFAMLDDSRDPQKLRETALANARVSPLVSMLAANHLDREGRTTIVSPGLPAEGEPDETWLRREIGQSESIHRAFALRNYIEPARITIHARFGIEERHLEPIIANTTLVPDEQKAVLCLGLARFFQGDMMSATYMLIPLMEASIRHLLKMNGVDTGKLRDDTTEEDYSLSKLFERFRPQLDRILGVPLAAEIDNLFGTRPGPALRHEMAHGQVTAGDCFAPHTYYANWLIYRMTCALLFHVWDQYIAPQITATE